VGFVVEKVALRFPLTILIPPTCPHSSSIIWGRYNVGDVPRGLSLTSPQETKKRKRRGKKKENQAIFFSDFMLYHLYGHPFSNVRSFQSRVQLSETGLQKVLHTLYGSKCSVTSLPFSI
jgi:hypothetical protein